MSKRKMSITELLGKSCPPTPAWPSPKPPEQTGDSSILQPFMQARQVSNEIRKKQHVIETLKFKYYFEDWGCLICETKDAAHQTLGMCARCYRRELQLSRLLFARRLPNARHSRNQRTFRG